MKINACKVQHLNKDLEKNMKISEQYKTLQTHTNRQVNFTEQQNSHCHINDFKFFPLFDLSLLIFNYDLP